MMNKKIILFLIIMNFLLSFLEAAEPCPNPGIVSNVVKQSSSDLNANTELSSGSVNSQPSCGSNILLSQIHSNGKVPVSHVEKEKLRKVLDDHGIDKAVVLELMQNYGFNEVTLLEFLYHIGQSAKAAISNL